jgi:predicted AlkP superfamily pyrophosphatase or phosphodiesterase
MLRRLAAIWLLLLLAACASLPGPAQRPLVVLVSIDGFRPDYLDRGVTPTLSRLAAEGVRATMRPSFPTKTFPNHYTLVTGLRPDRHGVVDNSMWDAAVSADQFSMARSADPRWWEEGTPIWVTAERQGVRTATMFWPGSDVPIHGVRPTRWRPFDMKVTADQRVDQALAWVDEAKPAFLTVYFDDVDSAGHDFGPDAPELNAAAARVDAALARLATGLQARGLAANLVIVADHGMAATSPERRIFADDLIDMDAVRTVTMGAFMSLYPKPGREPEVARALLKAHPRMQCWRKAQIPARYRYGKNPRVPPYFCLPATGWEITTHGFKPRKPQWGNHGYDPFAPEMAAIFVAHGPAFRRGASLAMFDNVDVYPLLARLLHVRPEANDGRLADTRPALTN